MFSHVMFGTHSLERAIAFYDATLAPLSGNGCMVAFRAQSRAAVDAAYAAAIAAGARDEGPPGERNE